MYFCKTKIINLKRQVKYLLKILLIFFMDNTNLGKRVRYLRGEMSQVQFAELIGTSKQNISKYENGVSLPELNICLAFHNKLNVNLNWFLAGKGSVYYVEDKNNYKQLDEALKENAVLKSKLKSMGLSIISTVEEFQKDYETKTDTD
jgi:transcriptional regulator with XRE-family HTH domain